MLPENLRPIDVLHLGRERVICAWWADGVIVDPGPESCVQVLLDGLGGDRPRAVLLTHIHFDHAGAAGALVRRWPDLPVYVHEAGAPHLADPERLVSSARRLYGEDFDRLWGEVVPVPQENLRILGGGEEAEGCEVAWTPGHAKHHVCYRHIATGWVFAGDMAGIRIPPVEEFTFPPTPPPDIDVEAWDRSLDLIESWQPAGLALTHFGAAGDAPAQIARVRARLHGHAERARTLSAEDFEAKLVEEVRAAAPDEASAAAFLQAAPPAQIYLGLARYWAKRAEAASS